MKPFRPLDPEEHQGSGLKRGNPQSAGPGGSDLEERMEAIWDSLSELEERTAVAWWPEPERAGGPRT